MQIKGSKTDINLLETFARVSRARNIYKLLEVKNNENMVL